MQLKSNFSIINDQTFLEPILEFSFF